MKNKTIENRMRRGEIFHGIRVPDNAYAIIRVDGRAFHTLIADWKFERPYDVAFSRRMIETARKLLESFHGIYAYTQSDEISVLLPRKFDLFDREVEKLVSLSASEASLRFTLAEEPPLHATFDSRVWVGVSEEEVVDYFRWRQTDAFRNALHGATYWKLREMGLTARKATSQLSGANQKDKQQILHKAGINFNNLPVPFRRGIGLAWKSYMLPAVNPKTGESVEARRRKIVTLDNLPHSDGYGAFIGAMLTLKEVP